MSARVCAVIMEFLANPQSSGFPKVPWSLRSMKASARLKLKGLSLSSNMVYNIQDIISKMVLLSELHAKFICNLSANSTLSGVILSLSSHSGGQKNAVYQTCMKWSRCTAKELNYFLFTSTAFFGGEKK